MSADQNGNNGFAKRSGAGRMRMQSLALVLLLGAPFGLYAALMRGSTPLSMFFFGLIAAGMVLTVLAG